MSEPLARHQLFEYSGEKPFIVYGVPGTVGDSQELLNHWHEELELSYCVKGNAKHYINGECFVDQPGRVLVTNTEHMHNIIADNNLQETEEIVSIVIIISPQFIEANFPEYKEIYFTNEKLNASDEVKQAIEDLYKYCFDGNKQEEFEHLYGRSLVLKLLYFLGKEGTVKREQVDNINILKNIERMKGVIQFIENHYTESIPQTMVAEKFYFSSVYFSRYFKKCTGMTFIDYITGFRVEKARQELLYTQNSISQIAMNNGFSDDRRFILAFKHKHGITPLQYRKNHKK